MMMAMASGISYRMRSNRRSVSSSATYSRRWCTSWESKRTTLQDIHHRISPLWRSQRTEVSRWTLSLLCGQRDIIMRLSKLKFLFLSSHPLCKNRSDPPPEEIINKFHRPNLIYSDVKIIVTAIITLTIIICSSSIIIICMKIREYFFLLFVWLNTTLTRLQSNGIIISLSLCRNFPQDKESDRRRRRAKH